MLDALITFLCGAWNRLETDRMSLIFPPVTHEHETSSFVGPLSGLEVARWVPIRQSNYLPTMSRAASCRRNTGWQSRFYLVTATLPLRAASSDPIELYGLSISCLSSMDNSVNAVARSKQFVFYGNSPDIVLIQLRNVRPNDFHLILVEHAGTDKSNRRVSSFLKIQSWR